MLLACAAAGSLARGCAPAVQVQLLLQCRSAGRERAERLLMPPLLLHPFQVQDVEHRRPYESLLLCWPAHLPPPPGMPASSRVVPGGCTGTQAAAAAAGRAAQAAAAAGGGARGSGGSSSSPPACGFRLLQGRPLVVAAVPPAAHSRKPHLGPLLLPLLPPGARCLEASGMRAWGWPARPHPLGVACMLVPRFSSPPCATSPLTTAPSPFPPPARVL